MASHCLSAVVPVVKAGPAGKEGRALKALQVGRVLLPQLRYQPLQRQDLLNALHSAPQLRPARLQQRLARSTRSRARVRSSRRPVWRPRRALVRVARLVRLRVHAVAPVLPLERVSAAVVQRGQLEMLRVHLPAVNVLLGLAADRVQLQRVARVRVLGPVVVLLGVPVQAAVRLCALACSLG
jgi:hypothetical protein